MMIKMLCVQYVLVFMLSILLNEEYGSGSWSLSVYTGTDFMI